MNKILNIEEVQSINLTISNPLYGTKGGRLGIRGMINVISGEGSYDGYKVSTQEGEYLLLISNGQNCCEDWGYFSSNDNYKDFIGKNLISVKLTDIDLKTKKIYDHGEYDEGGVQFVDFETDDGVLQLAVYNSHNGYYGHGIIIVFKDIIELRDTL